MNGAQQSGVSTTTQSPYGPYQPYIGTALGQAGNLLQSGGPQYYPGQQVASFNPTQQKAMKAIANAGMNGSPALTAAQGFDQTLLESGGGSNPYLDQMYSQAAGATQNQLSSEFAGMGRNAAGSQPLRAEQLNNLATSMYGGQYQNDIQNALQAGNQAQSLYGTRMAGLGAAAGVGQQVQDQSQRLIDASKAAFDYNQNLPWNTAQRYEGLITSLMPGSGQSTSPNFTNPGANLMDTALGAQQLYKGMSSKPSQGGGGGTD
jgi:hypothetical protein